MNILAKTPDVACTVCIVSAELRIVEALQYLGLHYRPCIDNDLEKR